MSRGRVADPFEVLRLPAFRFYAFSRFFSGVAQRLLTATVAWQVSQLSGSVSKTALELGFLGVVGFLPALCTSLVAGAVADSYDRRRIVLTAQVIPLTCSATLLAITLFGHISLPLIYGVMLLLGLGSSFDQPARQSLLPQLVERERFARAVTVASTIQQLAFVFGPVGAGLLIAKFSIAAAYGTHFVLILTSAVSLFLVRPQFAAAARGRVTLAAVREGIGYVRRNQPVLGAMTLDLFGVIFGGAVALLPIYAERILHVGAGGYGLLTSSLGVGSVLASITCVFLPPINRAGRTMLVTVAGFALATIVFGISRSFPLSLLAYALTGATDQISVIMRQTIIQLGTPDELRGRVSSVSSLFIGTSNQLGLLESGLVAAATNATFAVVSGGIGCLAVVGIVSAGMPELRRYRIGPPQDAPPVDVPGQVVETISSSTATAGQAAGDG